MSVMQSFQINFDNPQCTYFGGEMVTGRLHIRLDRSTRTRGIELKFRGEARVYWEKKIKEKDEEGNSLMSIEEHTSHELYFDTPFYVLGGPYILLQPGEHIYNFNMQLPSVLPSSFEGKLGYIRYTLLATLIQDMHANMVAKSAFTVLCPLDLNREQNVKVEVKISGLHKNMFIRVPIVIGTVPLATQASNSSGGRPEQFIPATVPTAPPAYEDCMLGAVNIQERGDVENLQGNLKFAPRYPVYRTQTPC
ncbi:Uncharacterized protein GBIM_10148 [Gryllus bimaculatus]|nr:Uncharacterized protein GBIM_10148 [Gryllus bimaculatus]